MDKNYRLRQVRSNELPYYYAEELRQKGSGPGIGALLAGARTFLQPLAKKYLLPIGKELLQSAAPEIIDVVSGKRKPRAAFKRAVKKTVVKQLGGRKRKINRKKKSPTKGGRIRRRRASTGSKTISKRKTKSKRKKKSNNRRSRRRVVKKKKRASSANRVRRISRLKNLFGQTQRRAISQKRGKQRSRRDFFPSAVDYRAAGKQGTAQTFGPFPS